MRLKMCWLVGLMGVLLFQAHGQPPSRMPQDYRGGFSSDSSKAERNELERNEKFDRYSEGRGIWDRSRLTDPKEVKRFDEMAQKLGSTSNVITRQEYLNYYQQRDQQANGFSREQGGGFSRGGFGGPPMMMSTPGSPPMIAQPGSTGMDGRSRSGFGPQGGTNSQGGMSSWTDRRFREYDRNADGVLSNEEIPETMRNERSQWDNNGDGFIDQNEYISFSQARMQQMQAERATNGTNPPGGYSRPSSSNGSSSSNPAAMLNELTRGSMNLGSTRGMDGGSTRGLDPNMMRGMNQGGMGFSRQREPDPPPRATVYRPGNLPRELPPWFAQRDTDNDGQIALYEWRSSGSALAEFQQYDGNNDGFVTVEEVLRDQAAKRNGTTNGTTNGTAVASTNPRDFGGRGSFGSRGGNTPSFDFSSVRPGGSGPDRERMMEMMSRAAEAAKRNGGPPPSVAELMREMAGSGERGGFGKGRGPGGGSESREGQGGSPRKGRGPGG